MAEAKKTNIFKEAVRKLIVALKRKPQTIGLVALAIAFVYYSFNLTSISNTTAKINSPGMGICGFITMLFSMLSLVCYMNAFPYRKKVNKPMLILMILMVAAVVGCDIFYRAAILEAVTRSVSPIRIEVTTIYIKEAYDLLTNHLIILAVSAVLVVLMPVYSKLLRKINTNVDIEDNGQMDAIELSE